MNLSEIPSVFRRFLCWLVLLGIGIGLAAQGLGNHRPLTALIGAAVVFVIWIFEWGQASNQSQNYAGFMRDLCNRSPCVEGTMGDTSCFFCSAQILDLDHPERADHDSTCLWARARKANPQ